MNRQRSMLDLMKGVGGSVAFKYETDAQGVNCFDRLMRIVAKNKSKGGIEENVLDHLSFLAFGLDDEEDGCRYDDRYYNVDDVDVDHIVDNEDGSKTLNMNLYMWDDKHKSSIKDKESAVVVPLYMKFVPGRKRGWEWYPAILNAIIRAEEIREGSILKSKNQQIY